MRLENATIRKATIRVVKPHSATCQHKTLRFNNVFTADTLGRAGKGEWYWFRYTCFECAAEMLVKADSIGEGLPSETEESKRLSEKDRKKS